MRTRLKELDRRAGDRAVKLVGLAVAGTIAVGVGATNVSGPAAVLTAHTRVVVSVAAAPVLVVPEQQHSVPTSKALTKRPVKKVTKRIKASKPVKRWLPSGTGMWLHEFDRTQGGDAQAIVARAKAAGLTHLFVQTGSSKKGAIGRDALSKILPATKGTQIHVIAWDFANLRNPEADARRLANASHFRCPGCPRIAAVAPDIETAAEGTKINSSNVIRYYTTLRALLAPDIAILATVPWPSEVRVGKYPYASTAKRVDAMLPMAYWYNRSPITVTATSMSFLKQFHRPVMPVGQGYDGRIDAPYLPADPHPYLSVKAFLVTARQQGATAVSLWSWDTAGPQQWTALSKAKLLYRR